MSGNLVLTSNYTMSGEAIAPFLSSLRLSGYTDDIVVIVSCISDKCRDVLRKYDATVVDAEYRGVPLAYEGFFRRWLLALKATGRYYFGHPGGGKDSRFLFVNCWRFFPFRDYLSNLKDKPAAVLLADIRDVVFQTHPFASPRNPGLWVASEAEGSLIRDSRGNTKWLTEAVGFREMRHISGRNAVCAGTTIGDYASMMQYLELMTSCINRRFFWALFDSIDQGLHNYFVHNEKVKPLHLCRNWNGPFLTLDSEVVRPENKNREGYLCNKDGSIIPMVHQYDRVNYLYKPGDLIPPCWEFYLKLPVRVLPEPTAARKRRRFLPMQRY